MEGESPSTERYRRILRSLQTVYVPDSNAEIDFGDEADIESRSYRTTTITLPSDMEQSLDATLATEEEFKILVDLFSHLSFCEQSNSWTETDQFAKDFDRVPNLAAFIHRMVEDAYLTSKRLAKFRGLYDAYETRMEYTFHEESYPTVANLDHDHALVEGLRQLSRTDNVNGLDRASEDVRGTLVWVAGKLAQARETNDITRRELIATEIVDVLVEQFHRPVTADRYVAGDMSLQFTTLPEFDRSTTTERAGRTLRTWGANLPYLLIGWPLVLAYATRLEDDLDSFYSAVPSPPTLILTVLVMTMLLPVALLWILANRILSWLGWRESLVHRIKSLHPEDVSYLSSGRERLGVARDRIDETLDTLKSRLSTALTDRIVRGYHGAAHLVRETTDTFSPNDWCDSLPDDIDPTELPEPAGDRTDGDPVSPQQQYDKTQSGSEDDEGLADTHGQSNSATQGARDQRAELLQQVSTISTDDELSVQIIDERSTNIAESELEHIIRDLETRDRKTDSELHARRRSRDKRLHSAAPSNDIEEIRSAVADRGLVDEVQKLLEMYPPEERRTMRAETGYRLDIRTAARTDVGRLGRRDELFHQKQRTETGNRCIGVAIDLSGSMDIFEAKVALAALGDVTQLFRDSFTAVGFRSDSTQLVTGPTEPFDFDHVDAIFQGGNTPLADGIREIRQLVKAGREDDQLVFVVTDGGANVPLSGSHGTKAVEDAAAQIERTRRDGIAVIGIGVGSVSQYKMDSIFEEDNYVTVDDRSLAEKLVSIYRDQLRQTLRR